MRFVDDSFVVATARIFVLVVVSDPERKEECDEEEEDIHDRQREACLEHGTSFIDIDSEWVVESSANIAKGTKVQVDVVIRVSEVGAACFCDSAKLVDAGNQRAYKAQVDEGDKSTARAGAMVRDECT